MTDFHAELTALVSEYRSTMDIEVLHSWAQEVVALINPPQGADNVVRAIRAASDRFQDGVRDTVIVDTNDLDFTDIEYEIAYGGREDL